MNMSLLKKKEDKCFGYMRKETIQRLILKNMASEYTTKIIRKRKKINVCLELFVFFKHLVVLARIYHATDRATQNENMQENRNKS